MSKTEIHDPDELEDYINLKYEGVNEMTSDFNVELMKAISQSKSIE
jgi:hypothetical protein